MTTDLARTTRPLVALSLAALLALASPLRADDRPKSEAEVDSCLARVKAVHGGGGPWAVVGYRMGERALKDLNVPRQSFTLMVVHRAPMQVQYTCMADGLQASTGASVGKLNLRLEEAPRPALKTTVVDRKTGRRLTFTIDPDLAASITDLPYDRLEAEGRRVAALPDDKLFRVVADLADTPAAK
jgi:formylmethanofuran dehydrogenase subunit E